MDYSGSQVQAEGHSSQSPPALRLTAKLGSGVALHFYNKEDAKEFTKPICDAICQQLAVGDCTPEYTVASANGSGWRSKAQHKKLSKLSSMEDLIEQEVVPG